MPTAKNSLTSGNTGTMVKKENKSKTIFDVIQAGAKQFATALPKHVNSERFVRIAITTIRQNPKLAKWFPSPYGVSFILILFEFVCSGFNIIVSVSLRSIVHSYT